MTDARPPHDPAAGRYFTMQLLRLIGIAAIVYALLALRGVAAWPGPVPRAAAWLLLAIGATDAFLVPRLLARRWRTPTE